MFSNFLKKSKYVSKKKKKKIRDMLKKKSKNKRIHIPLIHPGMPRKLKDNLE